MAQAPSRSPVKTINALKARQNLGQLLEQVFYRGDQFVIERAGKPMASVVPPIGSSTFGMIDHAPSPRAAEAHRHGTRADGRSRRCRAIVTYTGRNPASGGV
jgi:antitoxin (DNA-binding transcriptional repressor) of toxin-antitoxin stability system